MKVTIPDSIAIDIEEDSVTTGTWNEGTLDFGTVLPGSNVTGSTKVNVSTNNKAGAALKVKANDSADMKGQTNTNVIAASNTQYEAENDASGWAFKVAGANTKSDFQSWSAMKTDDQTIAEVTGNAFSGTLATVTYGVYTSPTQEADTYSVSLTYTATTK